MLSRTAGEARPQIELVAGDTDEIAAGSALVERAGDERRPVPLSRRYRIIGAGLVASDGICALLALLVAHATLFGPDVHLPWLLPQMAVALVAWVGSFHAFGLYHVRQLSALEEFRRLIGATCVATSLVILMRASANVPPHRRWLGLTWLLALAFELGARRLWRWQIGRRRAQGRLAARTVVLGTNEEAARLAHALRQPALGFHLLGHIATNNGGLSPRLVPVVGYLDQLDQTIRALGVEALFVASTAVSADDMVRVAQVARRADVEMRMSANMADILVSRLAVQSFDGVLALSVKPMRVSATQATVKRVFDLCLASIALVAFLPVMAVVAIAIRLSSPGPILFRQDRVTRDGRVFVMLKFRTMVTEAGPAAGDAAIDLTVPFFKLDNDPRITRVGRFLRKLSLDELPQLWQVITGDLSLVGPRPLPADQVAAHPELLGPRHEVRAGITGWWQINGRSNIDSDHALRMDLFYIENWSLSFDLFILLKTLGTVLCRRGAR